MSIERKGPAGVARRLSLRRGDQSRQGPEARGAPGPWRRETFTLPRDEARALARSWFERFPKAAYGTEIESWCERADGTIEFTMRRLPGAG